MTGAACRPAVVPLSCLEKVKSSESPTVNAPGFLCRKTDRFSHANPNHLSRLLSGPGASRRHQVATNGGGKVPTAFVRRLSRSGRTRMFASERQGIVGGEQRHPPRDVQGSKSVHTSGSPQIDAHAFAGPLHIWPKISEGEDPSSV